MPTSEEDSKLAQLAQRIAPHSTLLRTWQLSGGISAQMIALEVALPDGQTKKMIVRRPGAATLAHNPHAARDEYTLLQLMQSLGLAAPAPYELDQSGTVFSAPYLVIEYVEGKPEFASLPGDD